MPPPEAVRRLFLGLGANQGDRAANFAFARAFLRQRGVRPIRLSSVYETEPVDVACEVEFLNQVVEARTEMAPERVLAAAHDAEEALGRKRGDAGAPPGPRPLDIDLLVDGAVVLGRGPVRLPHPRLHLRRFVLVPFAEIAPEVEHPVLRRSIAALLEICPDRSWVRRLAPAGAADL